MTSAEIVGLNVKWYRYQNNLTQEQFADSTRFKVAYISALETGNANITCRNLDSIAEAFKIESKLLLDKSTALAAKDLPSRVDMYNKMKNEK